MKIAKGLSMFLSVNSLEGNELLSYNGLFVIFSCYLSGESIHSPIDFVLAAGLESVHQVY